MLGSNTYTHRLTDRHRDEHSHTDTHTQTHSLGQWSQTICMLLAEGIPNVASTMPTYSNVLLNLYSKGSSVREGSTGLRSMHALH